MYHIFLAVHLLSVYPHKGHTMKTMFKGMVHLTQHMASDDDFGPPE